MKQVCTSPETSELELLKNVLEEAGIHCVIKNEQLAQALPVTPFTAELWVLDDADLTQARALCHDWFAPAANDANMWTCPQCGQPLGSQFDSCWQCGTTRVAMAAAPNQEVKGAIVL